MSQSLNGVPLYPITINDKPLNVDLYKQNLKQQTTATLVQEIKAKPPKAQTIKAEDLAKSTATISELLNRAKTKNSPPPKAEQQKEYEVKLKI